MSSIPVRFKPEADSDLEHAVIFYEAERTNLGLELIQNIEEVLGRVQLFPESAPVVYRQFRQLLPKKFPFRIFYRIESNTIQIYAIVHSSRDYKSLLDYRINH